MKKLLSLLGAMGMVATSSSVTVACNKDSKTDLSALSTKALGDISGSGDLPVAADLVKAINKVNSNYGLSNSDVELDGAATTEKATLKAKSTSTKFTGKVVVTYKYTKATTDTKKDLSEAVKTKELGEWEGVGSLPTIDEVVEQVNLKNEGLNLSKADVQMAKISDDKDLTKGAKLTALSDSAGFSGSVEVTYTYTQTKKTSIGTVADQNVKVFDKAASFDVTISNPTSDGALTAQEASSSGMLSEIKVEKKEAGKWTVKYDVIAGKANEKDNGEAKESFPTVINLAYGNLTKKVNVIVVKNDLNLLIPFGTYTFSWVDDKPTATELANYWNSQHQDQKISESDFDLTNNSGDKENGVGATVKAKKESKLLYGTTTIQIKNS
ncbi:lipoprotein [Spiroplasma tabanidicola]|uniref:Lipoprotein n=1 Tax=Spiroplasma tabanidicola TaxID=324079 RepID=A0A6I6CBS0_9MOLU|nr:lipoprotein [Spiroplasma tabanidicola]QGS51424.1 hypothetical protein STABA_v1c00570 [Spiroplasma tabanidicola]